MLHGRHKVIGQNCDKPRPVASPMQSAEFYPVENSDGDRTVPLYEERIDVAKMQAVTDRVRVSTHVDERAVLIEELIERGDLTIERIAVERPVTQAPEPRQEGDTLIVSVVEERPVVERRLFVVEELRITRSSVTRRVTIPETLRTMRATIEREDSSPATGT